MSRSAFHARAALSFVVLSAGCAGQAHAPTETRRSLRVEDVGLTGQGAPTACYCMDALATPDTSDPSLAWELTFVGPDQAPRRAEPPRLRADEWLFVAALASYRCSIPGGARSPRFERATRSGPDVLVDLRWGGAGPPGAIIPAPGDGGVVKVHLRGAWFEGQGGDESCVAVSRPTRAGKSAP